MRNILNKKYLFILLVVLYGADLAAETNKSATESVSCQKGLLAINARQTPLINILTEIQNKCRVKIEGLEARKDEAVTYLSKQEAFETVLKAFLRYLGEKNYAFEYSNESLIRIAVMPEAFSDSDDFIADSRSEEQQDQNEKVNVVKVVEVIKGSQARSAGLIKDDLILEYDGIAISKADELIEATKTKSSADQVDIVVLRENYRLRFIINGGFIGVRIRDVSVSIKDLAVF